LQQKLLNDCITLEAGRLAPQSTFAHLPVLNRYINGANNLPQGMLLSMTLALPGTLLAPSGAVKRLSTSTKDFRLMPECLTQTKTPQVAQRVVQTSLSNRAIAAHYRQHR